MNKPIFCGKCGKCFYGHNAEYKKRDHEIECKGESDLSKHIQQQANKTTIGK